MKLIFSEGGRQRGKESYRDSVEREESGVNCKTHACSLLVFLIVYPSGEISIGSYTASRCTLFLPWDIHDCVLLKMPVPGFPKAF